MSRDEFLWVEKYRPKTIEDCILPENIKKTFRDFLNKGEVPNLLLSGPAGCGKTTVAKALCNELGVDVYVINGSDEGRFLDTVRKMRRTSLRPSHFRQMLNTKSSLLMRQITQPTTFNSSYGRLLRNLVATVDSSSPATIKIKLSNLFTQGVRLLSFQSHQNKNPQSQQVSSKDSSKSLNRSKLSSIQKSSQNLSTNTFPIGEESSTNVKDIPWVGKLIRAFFLRSRR